MTARTRTLGAGGAALLIGVTAGHAVREQSVTAQDRRPGGVPVFAVDHTWPKMPNQWILGEVSGIAIDAENHVWIIQRPRSLGPSESYAAANPPAADCCVPAPPVLEFDEAGNFIQGWGGPGAGYDWPEPPKSGTGAGEHGILVDPRGDVWIGGNGPTDNHILKFTKKGQFLLQIGQRGKSTGSNDINNLNKPAGLSAYAKTNELFIADGYANRRVIVFDLGTGAYKRHWGAYGNKPDDAAPRTRVSEGAGPQQFNTAHGIAVSNDGMVYLADRTNNRVQAFTADGAFVKEVFIARASGGFGTAFDVALSADPRQQFLYVADGTNAHVRILDRQTLEILDHFGRWGRYAGQWFHLHSLAVDSKGNIYTGETQGHRAQKFLFKGLSPKGRQ